MLQRLLEASRPITIPAEPYSLDHPSLPFAFVFVQTNIIQPKREEEKEEDDGKKPEEPPQKPPGTLYPITTMPDSNNPRNDEEIDWLKDE